MWVYNSDYEKWQPKSDSLLRSDYEWIKEELYSTRFYSKFLSGSTYVPVNDPDDIYDILGSWTPKSWFVSSLGSIHSQSSEPIMFARPIDSNTSFDYYTRFNQEYGLTLKNHFTPKRILRDALKNAHRVDVATTGSIDLEAVYATLTIDGVVLRPGHKVLVKDQTTFESLDANFDPDTYFKSNYYVTNPGTTIIEYSYKNSQNGLYTFDGTRLVRDEVLDVYERCVRFSVTVSQGVQNTGKQFHLSRLLSGYFPTTSLSEPIEFLEKKNWLMRHRVDYNNLFDINYYDTIRHSSSTFSVAGVTYSIPARQIAVGEFGVILNHQNDISTIVPNKYKVNLRGIATNTRYYWICGDESTLLKVDKIDFSVSRVKIETLTTLRSVSFYDDLRGVVVGDLNTILMTLDSGQTWKRLRIDDFDAYTYNKAIFAEYNTIYIVGRAGVFIEIEETSSGWMAYKRRITKQLDEDDENLLVDNINDILYTTVTNWPLSYNYLPDQTVASKRILMMVTDGGNIVVYDIDSSTVFDFLYLDFAIGYGDIVNVARRSGTNDFFFTNNDGLYHFDIGAFSKIGVGNSQSNTVQTSGTASLLYNYYANEIYDFDGSGLQIAGNNSLFRFGTYSFATGGTMSGIDKPDSEFEGRLRSKLLFMDYDMAAKLNFFTDDGQYRLPDKVTFDLSEARGYEVIGTASMSNPVSVPVSYVTGQDIKSTIKIPNAANTKGKVAKVNVTVSITCANMSKVAIALKKANNPNSNKVVSILKYGQASATADMVRFTFTSEAHTDEIYNVAAPYTDKTARMDLTPPTFVINNSFTTTINSNDLTDLTNYANGLDQVAGDWQLIVMNYEDAVRNPITLDDWQIEFVIEDSYFRLTNKANETNWWTYVSDTNKTFPYWSSTPPSDVTAVTMSTVFKSYASYSDDFPYLLNVSAAKTDTADLLRIAPGITYSLIDSPSSAKAAAAPGKGLTFSSRYHRGTRPAIDLSLVTPSVVPTVYVWGYLFVLETDLNWQVQVGDVLRIESSVVDANILVNRIEKTATRSYCYAFTEFNDSIVGMLSKTPMTVRNLNAYLSIEDLVDNFSAHPVGRAYSLDYSANDRKLTLDSNFNNSTAYYNLAADGIYSGGTQSMVYKDSFLKFGYSPTYNILDYLVSINRSTSNPVFFADKEYLAMPVYTDLVMANPWTASTVYVDSTGWTYSKAKQDPGNKLYLGPDLRLEWESLFINTFVDVVIYQPVDGNTYTAEKLLVLDKYTSSNFQGSGIDALVVEFDRRISYKVGVSMDNAKIQIRSRRKLWQISQDIQELNNIQRSRSKISQTATGASFSSYTPRLTSRVTTDSYAKILLSDADTVKELSAIFYYDYKNELSMNVTRLDKSYDIPISNTSNYNGYLYLSCSQKHELRMGDGVVLDFNGGTYSSQFLNQQYNGFQIVKQVINDYDFVVNTSYGRPVFIGNDTGTAKYLKRDPFLNYEPVDIIEVGADRKGNVAIQLEPDNVRLVGTTFSLFNVDYGRYRFRLVDGLTLDVINDNFPWLLDAEISDAVIGIEDDEIKWYKGIWESGRWFGGKWLSGTWKYGDWYGGTWYSRRVTQKGLNVLVDENTTDDDQSTWFTGRWYGGTWDGGTWANGRWYDGTWNNGTWNNGIWNDGIWNFGRFIGGVWVLGDWNDGVFNCDSEPAFWLDGNWRGGDFENGIWYNGLFSQDSSVSRFGIKSYNSRTAVWYGGKWKSGSFHSGAETTNDVSQTHKYSIWYSGQWLSGDWYGGIAYNTDFISGVWYGGILEEIQIIGMNSRNNSLILNGIFRFNSGDEFYVIDNNNSGEYSRYGSNSTPAKYTVLDTVFDEAQRITEVYVATDVDTTDLSSYKKNSGPLNLQIPNTGDYIVSTQSVTYTIDKTNEIRVKLNLVNQNIGDLIINLRSPNGEVINVKQYGVGGTGSAPQPDLLTKWVPNTNSSMVDTVVTTNASGPLDGSSSPYSGTFEMTKSLGVGNGPFMSSSLDYKSLTDNENGVAGDWSLYVRDGHANLTGPAQEGIMHSANNKVTVKYSNIGDPVEVTINGNSLWANDIRKGDYVTISLLDPAAVLSADTNNGTVVATITSYVEDVYGFGTGNIFDTRLVLAATASELNAQFFVGPGNDPSATPRTCFANIYARSNPNPDNVLVDWEIQFVNDTEVGAQIGYDRYNGFDTGLRVVSRFRNSEWRTGIWTNGIFENGIFESGIWYNGVFKGTWG